jgi:hypothetical protein
LEGQNNNDWKVRTMAARKAPETVWLMWYGGYSYSCPTVEDVETVAHADVVSTMLDRFHNWDGSTPTVDETSEAHVFYRDPRGEVDLYPDETVRWSFYHNTFRREAC